MSQMAKVTYSKKIVLLDVHAIVHRAYHALPDFASSTGEPTGALYGLCTFLLKLIKDTHPDHIIACYDLPEKTLRHEVYSDYKAGRKKTDDALVSQLEDSKKIFEAFGIPMYSSPGFEADDMLGTIVEKLKEEKDIQVVIASGDMDTMQLVSGDQVVVYTLKKGIKETIIYDEKEVVARFGFTPDLLPDYKGLRGDPSDNIIGIPGIGEKTATDLITLFGSIEDIYVALKKDKVAFAKKGVKEKTVTLLSEHEEEALFSKTLATIRRDAPIHFVLPEKRWNELVDLALCDAFCTRYEFRVLPAKIREALSLPVDEGGEEVSVDPELLYRGQLLYWILDPSKNDATLGDILFVGREKTLEKAIGVLEKKVDEAELGSVYRDIELPLIPVVAEMKRVGVKLDTKRLALLSAEYHQKLDALEKEIWHHAGKEFNVASPKQLAEVLFGHMGLSVKGQKKTASGGFSTKESELEKLQGVHPIIDCIFEYRELAKLLGTYIDTLPTLVDSNDRLHGDFLQMGAATGRMSSQNPNLQNIPNKTLLGREIRKSFIAEEGSKIVAFDYSQIELRIAAFLSGDKKMIEIFKTGQDVHTAVASEVFMVPPAEVTKEMRSRAKVINFGVMYGMGVTALQKNLGTDRKEAQAFLDDYFARFAGLASYLEEVKRETARTGYTKTFFGRKRYFPEINSKLPFMKASAERMAINAPIQGTEADIIKLAMIRVYDYLKTKNLLDKVKLLMQVHDELVYEIEEGMIAEVSPVIMDSMQHILSQKDTLGVPIIVNASQGDSWGELTEL